MDKETLKLLEECLKTANEAGVPQDQAEQFISYSYIPLPWQWQFHAQARKADQENGPVDIGVGGARGPGKSHAVLSQVALDDCQRVEGLKVLFLRQTGVAAKESFDDLIEKVVIGHVPYERVGSTLKVGKRGRVVLGGFKDANDIDKYIGIEYDIIIVEELNQLTLEKYTKLRGSLRTSKTNWRPRMYTSFNPGGLGHDFVKNRYVIPYRDKKESATRFIGSTYLSNPYLNKEYIEYLEDLKGDLGKMWREGEWDIFAGQAFSEFSRIKHVIRSLIPSTTFYHYLSIDWGYTETKPHAFSGYLHCEIRMKTEDGRNFTRVITYKEWAGNRKAPDEWASVIYNDCLKMGIKPEYGVVDSSMFNPTSDYGRSIADLFMDKWKDLNSKQAWISLKKGTKDRKGRKAATHNWLSIAPDDLPYWMITENCKYLIETIPTLIVEENNPEDIDTEGPDDPYDSATYYLYTVKFISVRKGVLPYKSYTIPQRVQWNKKGDKQMPLDIKEFENAQNE